MADFCEVELLGKKALELPSSSLILSRPILERNASAMLADVAAKGLSFRPHVKTLKSRQATRLMVGGRPWKVAASTVAEVRGLLAFDGWIEIDEVSDVEFGSSHKLIGFQILFAMPLPLSKLPELRQLSKQVHIVLLLDNEAHLDALDDQDQPW
ncbi:hypothetical protein QBC34DRAFT_386424, partial [Podospora aff. communis PSN243]